MPLQQKLSQKETLIAELESRMGLYRLFQILFFEELNQDSLARLQKPPLSNACSYLEIPIEEIDISDLQVFEQLSVEYTHLFIGPGKHISPHESVHRNSDGMLNNKYTASVRKFYAASGYHLKQNSGLYPDHICTELEYMESLIEIQIEALVAGDIKESETSSMLQEEFVNTHMMQWIPVFCDLIVQNASVPIYQSAAGALGEFIHLEKQYLSE